MIDGTTRVANTGGGGGEVGESVEDPEEVEPHDHGIVRAMAAADLQLYTAPDPPPSEAAVSSSTLFVTRLHPLTNEGEPGFLPLYC